MSTPEWKPASANELSRMMADNVQGPKHLMIPCGGRTALHQHVSPTDNSVLMMTTDLKRVIDYPYRDLTITVEAGIRIDELREILAEKEQGLPIDIPQSNRTTLGGAIATNVSGPSRFGYGTFRDYLIGVSAVDGLGRLFQSGGRVVKNVAGYDLCKLLIGSAGTLATITQVTLKLRPLSNSRAFVLVSAESSATIERMLTILNTSATRPAIVDILNPKAVKQVQHDLKLDMSTDRSLICIAFEGAEAETAWQTQTVISELQPQGAEGILSIQGDDANRIWNTLTEYQTASDDPLTFRASILPSRLTEFQERLSQLNIASQAHANGVVYGHLPDQCADAATARELLNSLSKQCEESSGTLVVTSCDAEWKADAEPARVETAERKLMKQIKAAFDPEGLLPAGRYSS